MQTLAIMNILFTRKINLSFFVRRTQTLTITDQGKRKFEKKLTWRTPLLPDLYYYVGNFCNLIGLEQWCFSLIWNTYKWKLQNLWGWQYKQIIAWFVRDIWHKYHSWYFKIISNFTRLTAREIMYNNIAISLVVFMSNIPANHAITDTNYVNIA